MPLNKSVKQCLFTFFFKLIFKTIGFIFIGRFKNVIFGKFTSSKAGHTQSD